MTTKSADQTDYQPRPSDQIDSLSIDAQWELEAAEVLLEQLWKELKAVEEIRGFALTDTLTFSPITHLVTMARRRTEQIQVACGELPPSGVSSIRSAAE